MKEKKLSDIFDERMIKILVLAVNGVVLVFLLVYIITRIVIPQINGAGQISAVDTAAVAEANAEVEEVMTSDENLSSIYSDLLANTTFTTEDGMIFSFGENGSYKGFYDTNNPDVTGYSYDVQAIGADIMLNIYDMDKENVVCYKMEFMNNGDIQLTYLDNGVSFVLTSN